QVTQQAEPGDIRRGGGPGLECGGRGVAVERRHRVDRGGEDLAGGLVAVVEQPHAHGLREGDGQARDGGVVAQQPVRVGGAGDGHAVGGFGTVDRVSADDRDARVARDGQSAAQDLGHELHREGLARPGDEVDRDDGGAAHRVDVAHRVRGGDAAPVVRVVDDGGEEVRGGEDCEPVLDADRGGVVAVVEAHEDLLEVL